MNGVLAIQNEFCPVCDEPVGLSGLRVNRDLSDRRSTQPSFVSFRCHHGCAAGAVNTSASDLAESLQSIAHRVAAGIDQSAVEVQ